MGVTVTTNLGLIKPDTNEEIRENLPTFQGWSNQNETNCNTIDGLFRHSTGTWSPTWTADTTNPTLGTGGSVTGKYIRLYPRMVLCQLIVFAGTAGFNPGSGLYQFSLPFAIATELTTLNDTVPLGRGYLHDANAIANCSNSVAMYRITDDKVIFRGNAGDYWRHNTPFTMDNNDRMSAWFMYPTAAA